MHRQHDVVEADTGKPGAAEPPLDTGRAGGGQQPHDEAAQGAADELGQDDTTAEPGSRKSVHVERGEAPHVYQGHCQIRALELVPATHGQGAGEPMRRRASASRPYPTAEALPRSRPRPWAAGTWPSEGARSPAAGTGC